MTAVLAILALVVAAGCGFLLARRTARLGARQARAAIAREVDSLRLAIEAEAAAARRQLELDARAGAQERRHAAEVELRAAGNELAQRTLQLDERDRELERLGSDGAVRAEALATRETALAAREAALRELRADTEAALRDRAQRLEVLAGETPAEIKARLVGEWIEEAKAAAGERLRRIDAGMNDPEHGRTAKHIMEVAIQRYQGHYLTERLLTNVPIAPGALPRILGERDANLRAIEEVSHVKLSPAESGESIRLEGQDSFGREIARRAITRFAKNGVDAAQALAACTAIAEELDREVFDLGKKAFRELEIPRSHPDIVKLVGKLNYRTSYTQNQWKHAIEAAFLCGMMASELALDVKVARRAALMHDIGKALTHEIDGSHAVIGADLARKLGESELVANAIGAHHTDEPFHSAYAYLVAAADAMSGARPGARRQQDDNYVERLEDLHRIAGGFNGVDRVYAVHGGREVRVHVQENRVSDARAVELSTEIAHRISDEMTFPGQIKVTVIREVRAVEVAS
jgi:ribonuclease Y